MISQSEKMPPGEGDTADVPTRINVPQLHLHIIMHLFIVMLWQHVLYDNLNK